MTENIHKHRILILDFGSQYTQLVGAACVSWVLLRTVGVGCDRSTNS